MTTKEAFQKLMETPTVLDELGLNPNTIRTIRKRLKDGKLLSYEKMEQILLKAGAKKKPEVWKLPAK